MIEQKEKNSRLIKSEDQTFWGKKGFQYAQGKSQ